MVIARRGIPGTNLSIAIATLTLLNQSYRDTKSPVFMQVWRDAGGVYRKCVNEKQEG